jgi:simple sugar transport system permease protein
MQLVIKLLKKPITATFLAILFGFIVLTIVLMVAGYNPGHAYSALFFGIFGNARYMSNVIIKSTPIILTGLGVAFAYKTGLFNIGAEGQYIVGTISAVIVGSSLDLNPFIMVPLVLICGMAAGAVWGGICGMLKAKFGINEVITSIMLNWIALYLNNFVVSSQTFHENNTVSSVSVNKSAYIMLLSQWKTTKEGIATLKGMPLINDILIKTDVNFGIVIAVVLCIAISLLLYRSTKGYQLRAVGANRAAAEFAGINVNLNITQSMLIAGAICGLAGAVVITGNEPHRISQLSGFENNGFNGLSVAFIAMGSPIGCIFAGLLFGGLLYGGQSVQSELGAPTEIINIMIGVIVFFVALSSIIPTVIAKLEKRQFKKQRGAVN